MQFYGRPDAFTQACGLFSCEEDSHVAKKYFRRARFKGGSKTTVQNTTTYTQSPEERQLAAASAEYARKVAPNAYYLNDVARKVLQDSLGTVQVDFNSMNEAAQKEHQQNAQALKGLAGWNTGAAASANGQLANIASQVGNLASSSAGRIGSLAGTYSNATTAANNTLGQLAGGNLPTQYQANMERSISSAVKNTMGKAISDLGNRGVLNSSVTTRAMNDIEKNASDAVARQYQSNINQAAGLAQQQLTNNTNLANNLGDVYNTQHNMQNNALQQQSALAQQQAANAGNAAQIGAGIYSGLMGSAGAPMSLAAAAQEAAQSPAMNLWNMSLGLNGAGTSALGAVAGRGTTTSTQTTTQSGGGGGFLGGLFGGVLNAAAGSYGTLWCFPRETKIRMADGSEKMIAHVDVGESVMSLDANGEEAPATVIHKLDDHADIVYNVCCKDGHCMTTLSQPLMKEDGSFVLVRDVRIGDILKGGGRVIGIIEAGDRPLYDLQTDGENIYFADGFIAKGGEPDVWGTK